MNRNSAAKDGVATSAGSAPSGPVRQTNPAFAAAGARWSRCI